MIGKINRFHGHGGLRGLYRHGRAVRTQALSLKYVEGNPKKPFRLAVVVSRKVSKLAVVRNRIRRRIFEIVRNSPTDKLAGYDLVFTVFSEQLANIDAQKLETEVLGLIQKALSQNSNVSPQALRDIVSTKGN
jgi:ribonuclease P protein component